MSVIIKGKNKPTRCADCFMYQCGATGMDECPLVEIRPHGRLIDADALAKQLGITNMDCYKCAWGNHGFCGRGGDFNDACQAIEDAVTIIPADEKPSIADRIRSMTNKELAVWLAGETLFAERLKTYRVEDWEKWLKQECE